MFKYIVLVCIATVSLAAHADKFGLRWNHGKNDAVEPLNGNWVLKSVSCVDVLNNNKFLKSLPVDGKNELKFNSGVYSEYSAFILGQLGQCQINDEGTYTLLPGNIDFQFKTHYSVACNTRNSDAAQVDTAEYDIAGNSLTLLYPFNSSCNNSSGGYGYLKEVYERE